VLGRHLFPNRHLLGGIPPIQLITYFYFSTLPLDQFVICILQTENSSKNPMGKIEEKPYNNMPSKTPLKPSGKNIRRR
jgi:hypothetical protein